MVTSRLASEFMDLRETEQYNRLAHLAALQEFLREGAVYKTIVLKSGAFVDDERTVGLRRLRIPPRLPLLCLKCTRVQNFDVEGAFTLRGESVAGTGPVHQLDYRCKNCDSYRVRYFLLALVGGDTTSLVKCGQYPPLQREPPAAVASLLSKSDLGLYRSALTTRNFNYGLAAVAYLRRIVENELNNIIDLLITYSRTNRGDESLIEELVSIKTEHRFTNKLERAAAVLPDSLKTDGYNPLSLLHGLTSASIHGKSDQECLQIFDVCQAGFEHVIIRLKASKDEDERFRKAMKELSDTAAKVNKGQL
jgi:hypothetical protein